ncbi:uncharacterized protein [Macrobrachium rosenbergii]|uniref:uncharacterized protein n=1 Tax=Macrobrachium rosenbergii TaxID=79674 RepID=UPI0034D5C986
MVNAIGTGISSFLKKKKRRFNFLYSSLSVLLTSIQKMARLSVILFVSVLVVSALANGRGQGQPPTFVCQEDGYFADFYRSCVVYYRCEGGVKQTFGCPDGQLFDEGKAACVPQENVLCPYPTSS